MVGGCVYARLVDLKPQAYRNPPPSMNTITAVFVVASVAICASVRTLHLF